jgi:uncharacterized protein (DUF1778 family)
MAKTITMRVDENTCDILKKAADGQKRTISNFIEYAAINYVLNKKMCIVFDQWYKAKALERHRRDGASPGRRAPEDPAKKP